MRVIRCGSCQHLYYAKRLPELKLGTNCGLGEPVPGGTEWMIVTYAECPECYALHTADFSLS